MSFSVHVDGFDSSGGTRIASRWTETREAGTIRWKIGELSETGRRQLSIGTRENFLHQSFTELLFPRFHDRNSKTKKDVQGSNQGSSAVGKLWLYKIRVDGRRDRCGDPASQES